jgi:hypothetical protein
MSFEECEGFVDDVCRVKNQDSSELPMLVLGNKNDRPADKQVHSSTIRLSSAHSTCIPKLISLLCAACGCAGFN